MAAQELDELRVQRRLPHSPADVWKALTDPAEMVDWMQATNVAIDPRPGGHVDIAAALHVTGRILCWEPPRVFEHEFKLAPSKPVPAGEDAVLRYELQPDGDGCLLTATFMRLTPATARAFSKGIHTGLDRLTAQLAARHPRTP